jgi:hypothetical protein
MSEPDVPPRRLERIRQLREADMAIIRIAARRPWPPPGRGDPAFDTASHYGAGQRVLSLAGL